MAGENDGTNITYNDIDANKMINKEGLLELSGQIKGYIQANMGSGDTITVYTGSNRYNSLNSEYRTTFDATTQAWLDSCLTDPSNVAKGVLVIDGVLAHIERIYNHKMLITWNDGIDGNYLDPTSNQGGGGYRIIYPENIKNLGYIIPHYDEISAVDIRIDSTTACDNKSKSLNKELRLLKNYYATKAELPQIPADPTTDGTYVLISTVSSGTATRTWENVVIGGSY